MVMVVLCAVTRVTIRLLESTKLPILITVFSLFWVVRSNSSVVDI